MVRITVIQAVLSHQGDHYQNDIDDAAHDDKGDNKDND